MQRVVQGLQTGDLFVLFGAQGFAPRLSAASVSPRQQGPLRAPGTQQAFPAGPSLNTAHLANGGGVPPIAQ